MSVVYRGHVIFTFVHSRYGKIRGRQYPPSDAVRIGWFGGVGNRYFSVHSIHDTLRVLTSVSIDINFISPIIFCT